MAFNGSGVFSRLYNWVNDRNAAIKIQAARMDAEMDGFAAGLSNTICRDGQSTTTAKIPFAQGINVAAAAPASPSPGDFWIDSDGAWARIGGITVNLLEIGTIRPHGSSSIPSGWILLYGQAISRTTYAKLFAKWSTTFGTGDGSTTFNVPDLRGRAIIGKDDMGGSAANRVTSGVSGVLGATLGGTGGSQSMHQHAHGFTELVHSHTGTAAAHQHNVPAVTVGAPASDTWGLGFGVVAGTVAVNSAGPHALSINNNSLTGSSINNAGVGSSQNMPPVIVMNWIAFAGA